MRIACRSFLYSCNTCNFYMAIISILTLPFKTLQNFTRITWLEKSFHINLFFPFNIIHARARARVYRVSARDYIYMKHFLFFLP